MAKKLTAAWRLFHYYYQVEVPTMFLYGPKYLEKVGYHVSGDAELDAGRASQRQRVMQSGAGIAELQSQGAEVAILNIADANAIYEDIQEHLLDWDRATYNGTHSLYREERMEILQDLEKFESIAEMLYPYAKLHEPGELYADPIRNQLIQLNRNRNAQRTRNFLQEKLNDAQGQRRAYKSVVERIRPRFLEG